MSAPNPTDEQAARAIESSLREAVRLGERPQVELDWLLGLPGRVRESGKMLRVAYKHAQPLLDQVRASWDKTREAERQREERLARAKAQPRNLECLRAPDPAAWNGLGRRKRRSRAFEEIGHAFNTRQRLAGIPPPVQSTPVEIQTLHTSPPAVPSRPATPPGLREAVFGCVGLLASASGVNAYGRQEKGGVSI